MTAYKAQHYLPKCYLREFASDAGRRSIVLYNILNNRYISGASIRHQCARADFYGDDLALERAFQPLEGEYALVVRQIERSGMANKDQVSVLRRFAALQATRTETAAKRLLASQDDMASMIFRDRAEYELFGRLTERQAILMNLEHADLTLRMISDLSVRVFRNRTGVDFITSDEPVVFCNRLTVAREKRFMGASGLEAAGLTVYLPLSPRYLLVLFDQAVYAPKGFAWETVEISKPADIMAINCLQFIRCSKNLYFADQEQRSLVEAVVGMAKSSRPTSWHTVRVAIPDREYDGGRYYRVVSPEEARSHEKALVHLHSEPVNPPSWFSGIPFRSKPQFVDSNTGRGLVRITAPSIDARRR